MRSPVALLLAISRSANLASLTLLVAVSLLAVASPACDGSGNRSLSALLDAGRGLDASPDAEPDAEPPAPSPAQLVVRPCDLETRIVSPSGAVSVIRYAALETESPDVETWLCGVAPQECTAGFTCTGEPYGRLDCVQSLAQREAGRVRVECGEYQRAEFVVR